MATLKRKNGSTKWTAVIRVPQKVRDVNPEFIQTRDGRPKTHLELATGSSDKREAERIAVSFYAKCEKKFQLAISSDSERVNLIAESTNGFLKFQKENPDKANEILMSMALEALKKMGLDSNTDYVREKISELRNGLSVENTQQWLEAEAIAKGNRVDAEALIGIEKAARKIHDTRLSIGTIFERYIRKRAADGPIKTSTLSRARSTFSDFCRAMPYGSDTKIESVTVRVVRDWVQAYQLQLNGEGRTTQTVKNRIDSIAPAFAMAEADEMIVKNPFRGYSSALIQTKRGVKPNQSNRSWINDDLAYSSFETLILQARDKFKESSRAVSHRHLMPMIALSLYTGARIEELCRLSLADIKYRDYLEVRYIDITEAKSDAGVREIPLLPKAEEIVDYLIARLPQGEQSLFPDLVPRDGRFSHAPSNEFSRFKKRLGYAAKNEYTFHSFRSTVITLLDREGVANDYISMMVGHSDGRGTLAKRTYSAGRQLKQLKEAVSCIQYSPKITELLQPPYR